MPEEKQKSLFDIDDALEKRKRRRVKLSTTSLKANRDAEPGKENMRHQIFNWYVVHAPDIRENAVIAFGNKYGSVTARINEMVNDKLLDIVGSAYTKSGSEAELLAPSKTVAYFDRKKPKKEKKCEPTAPVNKHDGYPD